jgi:hypothetical protein
MATAKEPYPKGIEGARMLIMGRDILEPEQIFVAVSTPAGVVWERKSVPRDFFSIKVCTPGVQVVNDETNETRASARVGG